MKPIQQKPINLAPKNPVSESPGIGYKVLHGLDFAIGGKGLYDASKAIVNRLRPAVQDAIEIAEPAELAPLMGAGELGLAEELPLLAIL